MLGLRPRATMRNVPAPPRSGLFDDPTRAARAAARDDNSDVWTPPVIRTVASKGRASPRFRGVPTGTRAIFKERSLGARRRARLRDRVEDVVEMRVREPPVDGRRPEHVASTTSSPR